MASPRFIVGIGGSAGGLRAYEALLDALPANLGMAYVFISHMHPTANNLLAQLLSAHTKMPVSVALDAMRIQSNHVYVIPPNADLLVERGAFKIVSPRTRRNAQIDIFFTSLAETMETQAIGVVLSGYDGDGAEGCMHIKARGGTTFAQDRFAEVGQMPLSARATGCVDFILPPEEIAIELKRIARRPRK